MNLETEITALDREIEQAGTTERSPGMVAYDFNSPVIGSPYVTGTGWLPDTDTSKAWARSVLGRLATLGERAVTEDLSWADTSWTDPAIAARAVYATVALSDWTEEEADRLYGTITIEP